MTLCPYCHHASRTRREHVQHLEQSHPDARAHNIARSRGVTVSNVSEGITVPVDTDFGPALSDESPAPFSELPSLPWTIHCTVCISYQSQWIQLTEAMEPHYSCDWCRIMSRDTCTREEHTDRYIKLYCNGGVCRYPHESDGTDDRICDWGCRGRVNNVYCKGHIPRLCPVNQSWLRTHFKEASIQSPFSKRLRRERFEDTKQSFRGDHFVIDHK